MFSRTGNLSPQNSQCTLKSLPKKTDFSKTHICIKTCKQLFDKCVQIACEDVSKYCPFNLFLVVSVTYECKLFSIMNAFLFFK